MQHARKLIYTGTAEITAETVLAPLPEFSIQSLVQFTASLHPIWGSCRDQTFAGLPTPSAKGRMPDTCDSVTDMFGGLGNS